MLLTDMVRPNYPRREAEEAVDEAHKMSATYFGNEVKYTKRFRLDANRCHTRFDDECHLLPTNQGFCAKISASESASERVENE